MLFFFNTNSRCSLTKLSCLLFCPTFVFLRLAGPSTSLNLGKDDTSTRRESAADSYHSHSEWYDWGVSRLCVIKTDGAEWEAPADKVKDGLLYSPSLSTGQILQSEFCIMWNFQSRPLNNSQHNMVTSHAEESCSQKSSEDDAAVHSWSLVWCSLNNHARLLCDEGGGGSGAVYCKLCNTVQCCLRQQSSIIYKKKTGVSLFTMLRKWL